MSNPVNELPRVSLRLALLGVVAGALLLDGCGGNPGTKPHQTKTEDAAVYNTQLGIAYLNQGELGLAKDKLDRAVLQDPSFPEAHSARAMLYERLGDNDKADDEFRTALRLAPNDPNVVNNYAVYLCQRGRTNDGVKRFEQAAKNALYPLPRPPTPTPACACAPPSATRRPAYSSSRRCRSSRISPMPCCSSLTSSSSTTTWRRRAS